MSSGTFYMDGRFLGEGLCLPRGRAGLVTVGQSEELQIPLDGTEIDLPGLTTSLCSSPAIRLMKVTDASMQLILFNKHSGAHKTLNLQVNGNMLTPEGLWPPNLRTWQRDDHRWPVQRIRKQSDKPVPSGAWHTPT